LTGKDADIQEQETGWAASSHTKLWCAFNAGPAFSWLLPIRPCTTPTNLHFQSQVFV